MKNIVIYSNCQSNGIRSCLSYVIDSNFYEIANYDYIQNKKELPIEILKNADVFIYQPTKAKHGIYSTDPEVKGNICSHLNPKCIKIAFPYIYNHAFWPFVPEDGHYKGGEPITKLKKGGHSLEKITKMFLNGEIDFEYNKRFNKCMDILREHEKLCDVKVSDFIDKNARNVKLFLTQNHPTTIVFIHCANQILKILGSDLYIQNAHRYPPNIAKLPGEWPQSTDDMRFWNFNYRVGCLDPFWIHHLEKI